MVRHFLSFLIASLWVYSVLAQGTCVQNSRNLACASTEYANDARCTSWCYNQAQTSAYFDNNLLNVQEVSVSGQYMRINTTGIPNYETEMTAALQDRLNSRPLASRDFDTGRTTANVGDVISFGQDIGYRSNGCSLGYWPPGPQCPGSQASTSYFIPLQPTPASRECYTGLGAVGVLINGVSIFNFWDGVRYRNNRWLNIAVKFEAYDLDICEGHSAQTQYHHHGLSPCLQKQLGEYPGGSAHSPLYGFAADGYPIYGPWQAANLLAQSCWKARDYSASSPTGCGVDGQRSCVLVDQFDISKGTTTLSSDSWGPRTDQVVSTQSGNSIRAVSGVYFEDYYFDKSCSTSGNEEALDQFNGHSHGDLGYHYHVTVEKTGLEEPYFQDVFPGWFGPGYAGALGSQPFYPPPGGSCRPFPTNLTPEQSSAHVHGKRHVTTVN